MTELVEMITEEKSSIKALGKDQGREIGKEKDLKTEPEEEILEKDQGINTGTDRGRESEKGQGRGKDVVVDHVTETIEDLKMTAEEADPKNENLRSTIEDHPPVTSSL